MILVINCGSSSIKIDVFSPQNLKNDTFISENRKNIRVQRLNSSDCECSFFGTLLQLPNATHQEALERIFQKIDFDIIAIAHRIVHGGNKFRQSICKCKVSTWYYTN